MPKTRIEWAPDKAGQNVFYTSTKNTGLSSRETLEQIMINLGEALGIQVIYRKTNAAGAKFYEPQARGFSLYQSASNTILEMSRQLSKTSQKKE